MAELTERTGSAVVAGPPAKFRSCGSCRHTGTSVQVTARLLNSVNKITGKSQTGIESRVSPSIDQSQGFNIHEDLFFPRATRCTVQFKRRILFFFSSFRKYRMVFDIIELIGIIVYFGIRS